MKSVSIISYKREANRKGGKNQKWIKNPTMKKATTIPNRVDIDEAAIYLVHVPKCNQVNHKGREDSDCTDTKKILPDVKHMDLCSCTTKNNTLPKEYPKHAYFPK